MSVFALTGARILAEGQWLEGHALLVSGGAIEAICPLDQISQGIQHIALPGGSLLPGFIDTQVNGGGGALFNDAPTVEGIAAIASAHRLFGTTGLLPTLISDDLAVVKQAIEAVEAAIEAGVPGVLGIHLEGPFLNARKHGIHNPAKMIALDEEAIALITAPRRGVTMVTLAPECVAPGQIAALTRHGVIVSAGHSLADFETMERAIGEGLTGVTHLFNAMSQLEGRAPGLVGAALARPLISGVIVDGHHVHPASLQAAFAARGADGLMLVTDAMPLIGTGQERFLLDGVEIVARDGALRGPDGTLAGSMLDMAAAVRNAMTIMKVDLATAARMASQTPATLLGLEDQTGLLKLGFSADIVHLDDDSRATQCWIKGQHHAA